MANKPLDTALLDRAIRFAVDAHAGTERRGKGFPYIVHPMEAMEIVATITSDQQLLAAAALHDTVEDTSVTVDDIRREFGERVASLVEAESDKFSEGVSEEDSWHDRKRAAIERLAKAPHDAKIVALGDKLSNMRAIYRDYLQKGDELWKIFHAKDLEDHRWHYHGLLDSLSELADTPAYEEFVDLFRKVFVRKYEKEDPAPVDMSEYEQSGDGYTAVSYNHRDGKHMIKLYAPFIPSDVPAKERRVAEKITKMGIPAPGVGRIVTDGKRVGVEFERINPKKSFARAISDNPSLTEAYAVRFAEMSLKLHSTPCDTVWFGNVKSFWLDVIARDRFFSDAEKSRFRSFVNSVPSAQTCLHGDLHFGNIITDGVSDWWIDLADFRYGHPSFDLGMTYLACKGFSAELTRSMFHMEKRQAAEFWSAFVRRYFPGEDEESVDARIAPFSALYLLHYGNRSGMEDGMIARIRELLLQ